MGRTCFIDISRRLWDEKINPKNVTVKWIIVSQIGNGNPESNAHLLTDIMSTDEPKFMAM